MSVSELNNQDSIFSCISDVEPNSLKVFPLAAEVGVKQIY